MTTKIDNNPKDKLLTGVKKLSEAVRATFGPCGKNVIIEKEFDDPHVTKDGATVAKSINLKDPIENMAAQLVKKASLKTCEDVGDGTTTSVILTSAFCNSINSEDNQIKAQRAYNRFAGLVCKELKKNSRKVKQRDIEKIAYISANNDAKIAEVVASAYDGNKYRLITAEASNSLETTVEIVNGMRIKHGMISRYYSNQPNDSCVLDRPIIAVFKDKISKISAITRLLDSVNNKGANPRDILLIAPDFTNEVTNIIVNNKLKGVLNICCVKSPGFGATREPLVGDLFHVVGNNYYYDSVMNPKIEDLGQARKVVVTNDYCDIIEGFGDVSERLEEVKKIKVTNINKEEIDSRIANLVGGVAVIKVGGNSEAEVNEKIDRFDDAICAVRAALMSGMVAGGGFALLHAVNSLKLENEPYFKSFKKACISPAFTILKNADIDDKEIDNIITEALNQNSQFGYNIYKSEICDMFKLGVVDPLDVTINALRNSVSTAGVLMTSKVALSLEYQD